jgi:hypothetical protein
MGFGWSARGDSGGLELWRRLELDRFFASVLDRPGDKTTRESYEQGIIQSAQNVLRSRTS